MFIVKRIYSYLYVYILLALVLIFHISPELPFYRQLSESWLIKHNSIISNHEQSSITLKNEVIGFKNTQNVSKKSTTSNQTPVTDRQENELKKLYSSNLFNFSSLSVSVKRWHEFIIRPIVFQIYINNLVFYIFNSMFT